MKTETKKINRKDMLQINLLLYGLVAFFATLRILTDLQTLYRRIKGTEQASG